MAIKNLTDEQVQTWTREQKDRWWLENVFRGNMAQLTIRSAVTGFLLGGLLSATNLYIGAKTGWTLGVGLTSVILAFAVFKVFSSIGAAKDFTILENNAMQSIATAAGYMTGPLVSGIAAYMMVKDALMPWWQMLLFNVVLSVLGVLVAFPMKRRFINDEQQPFPEGRACGVLLDTLYTSQAAIGLFKAKALAFAALFAGTIKFMTGENYHTYLQPMLGLSKIRWLSEHPIEKILGWFHLNLPAVQGIDFRKLDLNPSLNLEMFGAGGLMNMRYATNMLVGMIAMWLVTIPPVIIRGDVMSSKGKTFTPPAVIETGRAVSVTAPVKAAGAEKATHSTVELALPISIVGGEVLDSSRERIKGAFSVTQAGLFDAEGKSVKLPATVEVGVLTDAKGVTAEVVSNFNRGAVLNTWALWPGVSMLVCASMLSLFAKPQMFVQAFSGLFNRKKKGPDALGHVEVPLWISFVGIPIVGAIGVWMAHDWFGVRWVWGALSIPLTILLTVVAAQATALTSITPTGSLSKITQFSFGFLDRKFPTMTAGVDGAMKAAAPNPGVNLMTACMTTEVASNAANLLMDIKPGYMLGAKPRQQAIGHCIGIVAGALASTPLFYVLFLAGHKENPFTKPTAEMAGKTVEEVLLQAPDKFSFVGAVQWKGISDLITRGISNLPASALYAMIACAVFGVVFELVRIVSKNRSPISPLAIGLGIVLPPDSTLWMFLGAAFFWLMGKIYAKREGSLGQRLWIGTHEPICAGLVAGAALIGIGDILVKVFLLK
jgi:uncharacterized oligopeptide transporter (OPT) family protein